MAAKTAYAIQCLHDRNIVHLDLSVGNIIFDSETKFLKLIDFGYSLKLSNINDKIFERPAIQIFIRLKSFPTADITISMTGMYLVLFCTNCILSDIFGVPSSGEYFHTSESIMKFSFQERI